jgi:hypothetical protein
VIALAQADGYAGHDTNSPDCWCGPKLICADCGEQGPCLHGAPGATARTEVVLHQMDA